MRPRMTDATRSLVLDWMFLVGVALKGLDGLVELLLGVPLLFLSHAQLAALAGSLAAGLFSEDPDSLLAGLILRESARIDTRDMVIGAVYLIVHGVVKLAIVVALARGSRRVYPWAVGVLGLLAVAQIVELVLRFTLGVLLLTGLDLLIIALIAREWRQARALPDVVRLRAPWLRRLGVR